MCQYSNLNLEHVTNMVAVGHTIHKEYFRLCEFLPVIFVICEMRDGDMNKGYKEIKILLNDSRLLEKFYCFCQKEKFVCY